jgi:hypothetical protein
MGWGPAYGGIGGGGIGGGCTGCPAGSGVPGTGSCVLTSVPRGLVTLRPRCQRKRRRTVTAAPFE